MHTELIKFPFVWFDYYSKLTTMAIYIYKMAIFHRRTFIFLQIILTALQNTNID